MKVAVIGSGISGLGSAYVLATQGVEELVLYEKEESLGGHAKTVRFDGVDLDLGFMVFNRVRIPLPFAHFLILFDSIYLFYRNKSLFFDPKIKKVKKINHYFLYKT